EREGKMVVGGPFDTLGAMIVKVAPDYYLVRWRGQQGWVKRDEVIAGPPRDRYFTDRIQSNPSDGYALRYCAQSLLHIGHVNAALTTIDEAIRLRPKDPLAQQVRASILTLGKKDFHGAMESLDAAEKLDPTNSDTTYHRALCWAAQGEYGKAQVEFAKAI